MIRKDLVVVTLYTFCLTTCLLMISTTRSAQYDPWADINEDGKIDIKDIAYSARLFGTTGDSTKNVTVTNWPEETEMFPHYLCLKTAILPCGGYRFDLIEEDVSYLPYTDVGYSMWSNIGSVVWTEIYNKTFIYQSIPEHSYQILGMPSIYLPFNLSNYPSLPDTFAVEAHAYLGKISFNGQWTLLKYLGSRATYWTGQNMNALAVFHIGTLASPLNFTINAYERLAVRIRAIGTTWSGTTQVDLDLLCDARHHAMIQIPIREDV